MIARHWRGVARAEAADAYLEHLRGATFPQLLVIDGHRGAFVLRRSLEDGHVEFVVVTLWETLDAVRAFAGDDLEVAVVPAEARRSLERFDEYVTHYEVAARLE